MEDLGPQVWAKRVDQWARVIVPAIFMVECVTLLAMGLSHNEPINDIPNYDIHHLKSVKTTI